MAPIPPSPSVKVVNIDATLAELAEVNSEIRHQICIEGDGFDVGLVCFSTTTISDTKQIVHDNKDVVCQVLVGRGLLRVSGSVTRLQPGILCHIPKGVPHDFVAEGGQLILCYTLINTLP